MIRHDLSMEIKASPGKVFAFTTDFRNFAKWQEGVGEVAQKPDGPSQSDTTFTLTRMLLGQRIEAAGAVTEFMPDRRFAFRTTSGPAQLNMAMDYESIPGGTRLTIHLEVEPGGVLKFVEGAVERQLKATFDAQAQNLKSVLES
jgi:carbon monoxide dehydrogenase subunit G